MRLVAVSIPLVVVATAAHTAPTHAQGFAVNEHGTCVMARGGTAVARPCRDGSTINFNPSGIAGFDRWTASAGLTIIAAQGGFTDDWFGNTDDLTNNPLWVPHGFLVYGISERLAAGFGVFAPYGLGTEWESTFEGRFNGYNNDLTSVYFQPTVAYHVLDKVKVGAGLDFVLGSVKITQRVDLSEFPLPSQPVTFGELGIPFHTDFANAEFEASGATGVGGNFGVLFEPADWVSLGARYLTRVKLNFSGTADFMPVATGIVLPPSALAGEVGLPPDIPLPLDAILASANLFGEGQPLGNQKVSTSITMPDQVQLGFAMKAFEGLTFLTDVQWINWSVFDSVVLDFENETTPSRTIVQNFEDTWGLRMGFDWRAANRLAIRGGYLYHEAASPDETVTPLLPEGARNEFTIGFGYDIARALTLDLAYQYLRQNDRRGRVREAPAGVTPSVDLNSGVYSFSAHLFAGTVTLYF